MFKSGENTIYYFRSDSNIENSEIVEIRYTNFETVTRYLLFCWVWYIMNVDERSNQGWYVCVNVV